MKTIYFCILLLCLTCGCLSSCSDDDDKQVNIDLLYGTWSWEEEDYYETYTFYEDGSLYITAGEYINGDWDIVSSDGYWEYENGTLTFSYYEEGDIIHAQIVSLTSRELVLGDGRETMTLVRVSGDYRPGR